MSSRRALQTHVLEDAAPCAPAATLCVRVCVCVLQVKPKAQQSSGLLAPKKGNGDWVMKTPERRRFCLRQGLAQRYWFSENVGKLPFKSKALAASVSSAHLAPARPTLPQTSALAPARPALAQTLALALALARPALAQPLAIALALTLSLTVSLRLRLALIPAPAPTLLVAIAPTLHPSPGPGRWAARWRSSTRGRSTHWRSTWSSTLSRAARRRIAVLNPTQNPQT